MTSETHHLGADQPVTTALQPLPALASPALRPVGFSPGHALSIRHALLLLFLRRRLILGVAALIIGATALLIVFLPFKYRSEAKLLVRLGRESVVIDPTARIGDAAVPMEGRDKEINSEIELLKSRKLTERIVNELGAGRILGRAPDQEISADDVARAITLLEDKLGVEAVPDSNVLGISYESSDPSLSRDVITKLIDVYLEERSHVYREQGDVKFFQDQLDTARGEQADLQRELQKVHDTTGITDPDQQRTILLARIDLIQRVIDSAKADRAAAAGAIEALNDNVGRVAASRRRDEEVANQAELDARIKSLESAMAKAQSDLAWVNEVAVRTQALTEQSTLASGKVKKYAEAFEQARIDQEMGQARIGNISIAEPPLLPLKPKGPSRGLILVAGLFLAVTLGIGMAFLADAMDHTIRRVEHLHALGLAQTVSVPFVDEAFEPRGPMADSSRPMAVTVAVPARVVDGVEGDLVPIRPLRALVRNAVGSAAHDGIETGSSLAGQPMLADNAGLMLNPPRSSARSILPAGGNPTRPLGPLAISPRILSAVRGIVEQLIPVNEDRAAPCVIGVLAPRAGQGASTIAVHLAVALAHRMDTGVDIPGQSNRVLLLDADLESPRASQLAGAASARGLGEWLSHRTADAQSLHGLIVPTRQHLLDLLPAGAPHDWSLLSPRMRLVLQSVIPRYRHLVVDLPAVTDSAAAAPLAGLCDAVVLVCQADQLRLEAAQQTLRRLRDARANVALAVLNKRRYPVPEWAYRMS